MLWPHRAGPEPAADCMAALPAACTLAAAADAKGALLCYEGLAELLAFQSKVGVGLIKKSRGEERW